MKKHGQNRFDVTTKIPGIDINTRPATGKGLDINIRAASGKSGIDINPRPARKLPEAQIRDLTDTRSLEDFANRLNAARRDYRRFCFTVLITAIALASAAFLAGYIISNL